MSAGDVKFIGWQGANPSFQELEPSISYEPFRQFQNQTSGFGNLEIGQYVRAKVTRTLIVFSKDKNTFIDALQYQNNTLNLTYVDSDGSIKTKSYGNGWEILSLDESPAAKGFTKIRLTYEKAIAKSLAFFGVGGLSIDCVDGVCRIRYKNNNIETIDSGTGICTTGLNFQIDRYNFPPVPSEITEQSRNEALSSAAFAVTILCNGVASDVTEITWGDLPLSPIEKEIERRSLETSTFPADLNPFNSATAATNAYFSFLSENLWGSEQINETINYARAEYPDTQNISYDITVEQTPKLQFSVVNKIQTQVTGGIERTLIVKQKTTMPASTFSGTQLSWSKTGNTLTLKLTGISSVSTAPPKYGFGGLPGGSNVFYANVSWSKTIREYDVTGL